MLNFHTVRWKNLLSTGNYWNEIKLDTENLTLIMGENGAGKSTLLEALTFVLFNKPFRKTNKPLLVNTRNGKDCVVEVSFSTNGHDYKVVRGVKPNIFEIHCDGILINKESSSKDYQEYLEKFILKMNYKSFTQIVVLGVAAFTPFMKLDAADRRAIIEDLLDIQVFSTMQVLVKKRLQDNKQAIERNKQEINSKEELIRFIEKTLKSLQNNNETKLKSLIIQKETYLDQIDTIENDIEELETKRNELLGLTTDFDSLKKRHAKLISLGSKIETKMAAQEKDIEFYMTNDQCPTCRQDIDTDFKDLAIAEADNKMSTFVKGIKEIETEINLVSDAIKRIEETLDQVNSLTADIASKKSYLKTIQANLKDIRSQIDEMSTDDKMLQENQEALDKHTKELQALNDMKVQLVKERQLFECSVNLLKDSGIKAKIVKQYLPVINKSINKYLAALNFLVDFNINEKFEETIKSRYRDTFLYENFSQGEKMKIDVSLLLAWRAIAKIKNSAHCNLLILDEIFDSSLDANSVDAVMNLLNTLKNEANIFIISHRGDVIRDKFTSTIQFENRKGFSRISKGK